MCFRNIASSTLPTHACNSIRDGMHLITGERLIAQHACHPAPARPQLDAASSGLAIQGAVANYPRKPCGQLAPRELQWQPARRPFRSDVGRPRRSSNQHETATWQDDGREGFMTFARKRCAAMRVREFSCRRGQSQSGTGAAYPCGYLVVVEEFR